MESIAFYALSAITIAAAVMMLIQKNPVASVLWLVVSFVGVAGLFVVMQAYFLAVVQVLVYGGAIMVLFLFVIMLLDLREEDLQALTMPRVPVVGVVAAALFLVAMIAVISASEPYFELKMSDLLSERGSMENSVKAVGMPLFREWLLPFEATSILLLSAIVGAVALTKRKL